MPLTISQHPPDVDAIVERFADADEGRSVLIATSDQLTAALALLELDGIARRLVLCPSDLPVERMSS